MERAPPALAADDHPPSPPPPPTPAPISLPGTPADYPTPAEHPSPQPDSPPPPNPPRTVRRSARFRRDADQTNESTPQTTADDSRGNSPSKRSKRVTTDNDARDSPHDHDDSSNPTDNPSEGTERVTESDNPDSEKTQPPSSADGHLPDQSNPGDEDTQPPETEPASDPAPDHQDATDNAKRPDEGDVQMNTEDAEKSAANPSDHDDPPGEPESSEPQEATKNTTSSEPSANANPEAVEKRDTVDNPDTVEKPDTAVDLDTTDRPNTADDAVNDTTNDDEAPEKPSEWDNEDDDPEAEPASADASAPVRDEGDDVENVAKETRNEVEATLTDKPVGDDAMDVDQPEMRSEEPQGEQDSAMEVDQPDEGHENQETVAEEAAADAITDDSGRRKSGRDSSEDVTDSEDEIQPDVEDVTKSQSPPPSPPMTRRRLATRAFSPPESPPITTRSRAETPKTAPHKSSKRSSSSEDVIEIEKATSSRYETRSSARGSSPMRTRRRRHSEPAPVSEPAVKSRTRGKKKYARKPVKGDRLRVMWHIDNIYYEGVVDSVLAFRGKRFYDITYDSGEREYYLELTHRKWRFADGRDGDDEDEEDEESDLLQKDIDYSKYPQIGDRILVMWHVDGKYYPGKVNDILKANGAWFYDVNYEGGDREFFLDLTIRKWKYPDAPEDAGKHPLVDRKIPKPAPKPKPKPRAKPKPKRVARKSIGPGSSAFTGDVSPPQSPPRPSRRARTLQKLLDDHDSGIDRSPLQEDVDTFRKKPSPVDEVLGELDRTAQAGHEKDSSPRDESNKRRESATGQPTVEDRDNAMDSPGFDVIFDNFGKDLMRKKPSSSQENASSLPDATRKQKDSGSDQRAQDDRTDDVDDSGFDVVFENFDNSTMDVLDEMRPPLSSQSVLKRPRTPPIADASLQPQEKEKDTVDMSDIFGDLLKKPPLPLPTSPSSHLPLSPPPRPRVLAERSKLAAQRDRPLSPLKPQPATISRPTTEQRPGPAPGQSILKRRLAEQSSGAPLAKRQAIRPKPVPKSTSMPPRRLKTIEPTPALPEKPKEPAKSGDDPNVSDIVSVAGIVAKKWAREEASRISSGMDKLKKHLSSLRTMHSKSLMRSRQKERTAAPDARILPDDEAEPQINTLGTSIVALVRKYRDTVEEREKRLKNQFTRMRTKITEQNENLVETADVLSGLDIVGLEALNGLQPKVRKRLEIPPPLPPRQGSQAYTQPPVYALAAGVSRQQFQGPQGSPGSLGQQNDAVVRNLRRRLADLVTRSEWLGDEVKRLQGREKTLFREKTSALAELRKAKRGSAIVDLTSNGKGRGIRASGRSSLPASKPAPPKPVGITKRRTRTSSVATTAPSTPASKGSGKALRKTLPRSNSKYKAPPPEPLRPVELTQPKKSQAQSAPANSSTAPVSAIPPSQSKPNVQSSGMPNIATTPASDAAKTRNVPSALQVQMDKQASDLVSLTFTVWLLQDESRNEPPDSPGERMDTWVRGCVKKCLTSALTFLTASGGIFRARSNLKADVDNENIYTDWIMAAPSDDASIERARGNYSLWDPSLRDSEWQAEKRVLRGLNICYQKALSMTPAANFSATLMYAKAVLNKAIADFESFMPRTITMLPTKRTTPATTGQQLVGTQVPKTVKPIQPRSIVVPQAADKHNENAGPKGNSDGAERNQAQGKELSDPKAGTNQTSDLIIVAKSGQTPTNSAAVAPGPLTASPTVPSSSTKPVGSTGPAPVISANAGSKASEGGDAPPKAGQETVTTAPTTAQPRIDSAPKDSASLQGNKPKAALKDQAPSTSQPQSAAAAQSPPQADSTGSLPKKSGSGPPTESTPRTSPPTGGTTKNATPEKSSKESNQKTAKSSKSAQPTAGPASSKKASSQQSLPEKSAAERQDQASSKALGKSGMKMSASQAASPKRPNASDAKVSASDKPSASRPITSGNVDGTETKSATVQPAASHPRNIGTSSPGVQGTTKSGRAPKQSRAQTRSQKKGTSSGQGKGSRKQVQPTDQNLSTPNAPSATTGAKQATVGSSTSRLQEIPRKHVALGAPRAPLELPRVSSAPASSAQASSVGVTGTISGPAQRTYPMLSRNQVRVTNPLPSAPLLSRNQVIAGKRPQVGVAQMTVPAAPQRRVAPGMQPSGMYGPSHEPDAMEVDAGREFNPRRNEPNPLGAEHHDIERGTGAGAANDLIPTSQAHPPFPDDTENTAGVYTSSPPLNVLGRRQNMGPSFQPSANKRQIGFKSLPQMTLRQSSQPGLAADGGNLPQLGMQGRVGQNAHDTQRATSGPTEPARTSEAHGSEYPYGHGSEPVYSPYNPAGQERDLPVDLMNPPTPSSFAGLDGYGISLGGDQVNLQRDSLPATPSDFDRYGIQSPINLERQNSRGTPHQVHPQSQGQLGHIMNPQRRDGGGFSQPQRFQGRGTFPGRG